MKTVMPGTLVFVLLISSSILAQEKAEPSRQDNATVAKVLTVSGRVGKDGRTLLTDLDSEWMVSNAEVLKGSEGRLVTIRCLVDSIKNRIQVLSVKKRENDNSAAARYSDSAFRR